MSDADQASQALAELWDIVKCRCHEAYTGRGLHDPDCQCDSTDAVQTVADRIEAMTAKLAKAVEALRFYAWENEMRLPSDGPWGAGSTDFGKVARATLAEISSHNKGESHE